MGIVYRHISPSGKSYIGQTKYDSWEERAGNNLFNTYGTSRKFYNAIRKYGWDNFSHEILESGLYDSVLRVEREKYWIIFYDSIESGYNLITGINTYTSSQAVSKEKLPVEQLIEDYNNGLSLTEIGDKYEVHFTIIYSILKDNNVIMRTRGARASTFSKMVREKTCPVCQNSFIAKKSKVIYCSRKCGSFAASCKLKGISVEEGLIEKKKPVIVTQPRYVFPDSYTNVQKGGIVRSHQKWHEELNRNNPKCICCQQDSKNF